MVLITPCWWWCVGSLLGGVISWGIAIDEVFTDWSLLLNAPINPREKMFASTLRGGPESQIWARKWSNK